MKEMNLVTRKIKSISVPYFRKLDRFARFFLPISPLKYLSNFFINHIPDNIWISVPIQLVISYCRIECLGRRAMY